MADLFLKILEGLADQAMSLPAKSDDIQRQVRAQCLSAIQSARPLRDPLDRLEIAADTIAKVSNSLNTVLLPTVENFDNIFEWW